jgi:uncharacterized membrane protein
MVKTKKSRLAGIPAWALSLITFIVATLLIFILAALLGSLEIFHNNFSEVLAYIFYGIVIAVACFFICKIHPKSFWYTPVICNLTCIIAAVVEPGFWTSELGIVLGGSFLLSYAGAIIGARTGRRLINQA